jgi:anthranilate phosphoribosyltransferase
MEKILEKLRQKENLTFEESKSAFELLMTGKASEDEIYNFLTLLSEKG